MRRALLLAAVWLLPLCSLLAAPKAAAPAHRLVPARSQDEPRGGPASAAAPAGAAAAARRAFRSIVIDNPCPHPGAEFGSALTPLDFDGDGKLDFAIGAAGEGAVYVVLGSGPVPYTRFAVFDAHGRSSCEREASEDRLGTSLAAADLDGDGDDELVAGAPTARLPAPDEQRVGAIYVFGLKQGGPPLSIQPRTEVEECFGQAVAFADFDLDGTQDLVVGAFRARQGVVSCGEVTLFHDVLDEERDPIDLPNPNPTEAGCFGAHLAVDDFDGDGHPDLFVAGIGNDSGSGYPHGGQVYCYPGDPRPERWIVVEDSVETPSDPSRFGMHLAARGGFLAVGAPRKDTRRITDSGLGQSFSGTDLQRAHRHGHPHPKLTDLFGYRALIGNFVGDESLDFAFSCLPNQFQEQPNPLAVYIFDGADKQAGPTELLALPDSGDHFTMGVAALDVDGDGRDDLVLGDARYDRPQAGQTDNVGRVVIYH